MWLLLCSFLFLPWHLRETVNSASFAVMKTVALSFLLWVSSFVFSQDTLVKKYFAMPNKVNGVFVFAESEPIGKYYSLGWLTKIGNWTGTYTEFRNGITKRAKKKYPNCDAIIFQWGKDFTLENTVEVIKLMD